MEMTHQNKTPVSIVMPVYNEEDILEKTIRDYYKEIIEKLPGSQMVIVDDCSTDSSPQILRELEKELKDITVIKPHQNVGHGKALLLGFENVKHDLIFTTDSDYQNNPDDFWKLFEEIDNHDLVIGYRTQRHDPFYRLIITRLLRLINIIIFRFNIKDANSPFKLIRRQCLSDCLKIIGQDAFSPSIMLALTAKSEGYRIKEIPVEHFERKTGRVTIANLKIIKPCLITFSQISL